MKHFFVLISLFCLSIGFSQTYTIEGKVTYNYYDNISALAGATVYLESGTTTMTTQVSNDYALGGAYSFSNVAPGTYSIRVLGSGSGKIWKYNGELTVSSANINKDITTVEDFDHIALNVSFYEYEQGKDESEMYKTVNGVKINCFQTSKPETMMSISIDPTTSNSTLILLKSTEYTFNIIKVGYDTLKTTYTTPNFQGGKNFYLHPNLGVTVKLIGNIGVENGQYDHLKIELTHIASQRHFHADILNNGYEFPKVSIGKSVFKVLHDLIGVVGMDTIDIQDNGSGVLTHNLVLAQTKIKIEGQILDAQGRGFDNVDVLLIAGSDTLMKTLSTYMYNPQYISGVYSASISKGGNVKLEASYPSYPSVDSTFVINFDSLIHAGVKLLTLPTIQLLPNSGNITVKFKTVVYENGNPTNVQGVKITIFSANEDTLAIGQSDVNGEISLSFTGYLNMNYNYMAAHPMYETVNAGMYIDAWESYNVNSIYMNKKIFNVVNLKVEKAADTISALITWSLDPLASEYTVEEFIVQRYNGNFYEPIAQIAGGNPMQFIDKNVQAEKTYCYTVDVQYTQGRSNFPVSLAECVTFVDYPVYKVYGLAKGRDYSDQLTAISNVKIILKNENQYYETYTDYNGNYTFYAVIPGEYTLSVLASIQGSVQKYNSVLNVTDANLNKNFNTEKDDRYFEYNATTEEKGSNGDRLSDVIIDYCISSNKSTLVSTITQYGSAYLYLMKDSTYTVHFSKQGYDTLTLTQKFTSEESYGTYQLQPNLGEIVNLKGSVNSTNNEFDGLYVQLINIATQRKFLAPILDNAYEFEGVAIGKSILQLVDEILGIVGVDTIEVMNPGGDVMTLNLTIAQIKVKVYGFVKDISSNSFLNDAKVYMIKASDTILNVNSGYKSLSQEPWSYQGYYESFLTQGGLVRLLAKKEGYATIDTAFEFPFQDLIAAKTKEFALPMLSMQAVKGNITAIFQTVSYNTSTYVYDTVIGANFNLTTSNGELLAAGVSNNKGLIHLNFEGYLNFDYKLVVSHPSYDTLVNNNQIFSTWNSPQQQVYLYKKAKVIYPVANLQLKDTLGGKALISWNLHKDAADYTVFRYQVLKKDKEGNFIALSYVMGQNALRYIDTAVEKEKNYCYVVDVYYSNPSGVGYYARNDAPCLTIPLDTCLLPTALAASSITDSSAILSWTSTFFKFEVLLFEQTELIGDTLKLGENTVSINKLKENTTYICKVRSLESGKISSPWASLSFTTLTKILDNNNFATHTRPEVYPNPTTGIISLNFGQIETNVNIQILSITGEILNKYTFKNTQEIDLDISPYSKGMYVINIQTNKYNFMKKVVKK